MTAGEGIIFALQGCRERTDAVQLPVSAERIAATGKNLMTISLVAHIPNDAVLRSIEYVM